jgi:phosphopantothenoylcysteine synthetase/decarboxylase
LKKCSEDDIVMKAEDAMKKEIVLGITGSVAAYKACDLARLFIKGGYSVSTVLTANACRLVTPLLFSSLTGGEVYTDMWQQTGMTMGHISLKEKASILVISPATANIIAKCASGIADDLLSTTYLSVTCPVLIAPAMNPNMWNHPATRENIQTLIRRGVSICGPESGAVACGDEGEGKMSDIGIVYETACSLIK